MQLKRWDTGELIFEMECGTFRELVEVSIKAGVSFYRANMSGADMSGANMRDANISYANMSYANMSGADMSGADMSGADMRDANISYANMSYANMRDAILSGADMSDAILSGANLRDAIMRDAILSGADMSGADMSGANMRDADMSYAVGNMEEVKSMQLEKYMIAFTSDILCIGCQQYTIEEWASFTDEKISQMDHGALEWWKKWKDFIFSAIEMTKGA